MTLSSTNIIIRYVVVHDDVAYFADALCGHLVGPQIGITRPVRLHDEGRIAEKRERMRVAVRLGIEHLAAALVYQHALRQLLRNDEHVGTAAQLLYVTHIDGLHLAFVNHRVALEDEAHGDATSGIAVGKAHGIRHFRQRPGTFERGLLLLFVQSASCQQQAGKHGQKSVFSHHCQLFHACKITPFDRYLQTFQLAKHLHRKNLSSYSWNLN